jgi:hypothetical protein
LAKKRAKQAAKTLRLAQVSEADFTVQLKLPPAAPFLGTAQATVKTRQKTPKTRLFCLRAPDLSTRESWLDAIRAAASRLGLMVRPVPSNTVASRDVRGGRFKHGFRIDSEPSLDEIRWDADGRENSKDAKEQSSSGQISATPARPTSPFKRLQRMFSFKARSLKQDTSSEHSPPVGDAKDHRTNNNQAGHCTEKKAEERLLPLLTSFQSSVTHGTGLSSLTSSSSFPNVSINASHRPVSGDEKIKTRPKSDRNVTSNRHDNKSVTKRKVKNRFGIGAFGRSHKR